VVMGVDAGEGCTLAATSGEAFGTTNCSRAGKGDGVRGAAGGFGAGAAGARARGGDTRVGEGFLAAICGVCTACSLGASMAVIEEENEEEREGIDSVTAGGAGNSDKRVEVVCA